MKARILAVGTPLPLAPRPNPLTVPPLPAAVPLLGGSAGRNAGAGVAYFGVVFEDVGGLSTNEVSLVLQSHGLSKPTQQGTKCVSLERRPYQWSYSHECSFDIKVWPIAVRSRRATWSQRVNTRFGKGIRMPTLTKMLILLSGSLEGV